MIVFTIHMTEISSESLVDKINEHIHPKTFIKSVFCPQRKDIHSILVSIETPRVSLQGMILHEMVTDSIRNSHLYPGVKDTDTKITIQWSKKADDHPDLISYRFVFIVAR